MSPQILSSHTCLEQVKALLQRNIEFLESANHLGRVLAERKIHLVYGGGSLGLMGGVSIAAFLRGNQVLGVVPKALAKRDIIGKTI